MIFRNRMKERNLMLIGMAFGIGFTFGPLIGYGCFWIRDYYPTVGLDRRNDRTPVRRLDRLPPGEHMAAWPSILGRGKIGK